MDTNTKTKSKRQNSNAQVISSRRKTSRTIVKDETNNELPMYNSFSLSSKKSRLVIGSLVLLIALSAIGYFGYNSLVLAWVDNTPITRFTLYKQMEEKFGKEFTEQLIVESLVNKEAKSKGIEVSEMDIDMEVQKIEASQGGADKLSQAMAAQSVTMPQLRNQIKFKLLIDRTFGKDMTITEQELADYMEKNKAQIPPMEGMQASESAELKKQISDSLKNEKVTKSFQEWLKQAQESPRVKKVSI